jgi:hypothetical protein
MCVSCASRCVAHMQTAQELARQESGKTLRAAGTALHSHCAHLIALTRKKTNGAAVGTARSTPLHPHAGSARGFRRSQHRAQSGTRTRTPTLAGRRMEHHMLDALTYTRLPTHAERRGSGRQGRGFDQGSAHARHSRRLCSLAQPPGQGAGKIYEDECCVRFLVAPPSPRALSLFLSRALPPLSSVCVRMDE